MSIAIRPIRLHLLSTLLLAAVALLQHGPVASEGFKDLVLKFPVTDTDSNGDDIDEAIRSKSIELGINHVFFAPLYKQVEAVTGKPYRHMTIHHLCDARLAKEIADLNDDLVVMMPCRIAVVESKKNPGSYAIYSTSPKVILEDPDISDEQKRLIRGFMPKLQQLTRSVARGEF